MANTQNKNSQYINSLVSFILDTKPYHSKLSETVEEYQFLDTAKVKFTERLSIRAKLSGTWLYNYFSGANPNFRTSVIHRLEAPMFARDRFTVGADEHKDLALVPYAYSKKAFDGVGVNAVLVRRASGAAEPFTESVDYFQSHGAFQFQIKQTHDANGEFVPLWTSSMDNGVVGQSIANTRTLALDRTNPSSAINRVIALLSEVQAAVTAAGGDVDVQRELDLLFEIIAADNLPQSYEALIAWLGVNPLILVDREELAVNLHLQSPPLFFGQFSDIGIRESGLAQYESVESAHVRVFDIQSTPEGNYEEWTLTAVDEDTPLYRVSGSVSNFIGFVVAGDDFSSPEKVSFKTEHISQAAVGHSVSFAPANKLIIHPNAPLETWNIIKVNPIAHDRPYLVSTGYGKIQDSNGVVGKVTVLDPTLPTTDIVLEARSNGTTFDLSSSADPTHTGVANAGVPFNDGRIAFTIIPGIQPFATGDRFYIPIENLPASAENVDLGYGYDLDPYDNDQLLDDQGRKVGFFYDGRFTDYDTSLLNIEVSEAAVSGRKWRARALPSANAIATIKKDGSGPNIRIDLTDATSGVAPDPALDSVPLYSMDGDANTAADLFLYYADTFSVEYSDDDFVTTVPVSTVGVGQTFNSVAHGVKFTIQPGSKPFVAVSSDDGLAKPRVEGGDVFSFTVNNPFPSVADGGQVGLTSSAIPRLQMHSDGFHYAPAARWTVTFTSPTEYVVSATQLGENEEVPLAGSPISGTLTTPGAGGREGRSFNALGVHFTVVPNAGIYPGDTFTFQTFARKPSYLVHGSVSGWAGEAVVGQYFWNGKIGFKLDAPTANLYQNGIIVEDHSTVGFTLNRVREDLGTVAYLITKTETGYMVSRTDTGVLGFVGATGEFNDTYVSFALTGATFDEIKLDISSHDFPLFNGQDLVILRPTIGSKLPKTGEHVIVEKTEDSRFGISLTPGGTDMSALAPITIDPRFIDTDTNSPIPLSFTSPETAILRGWLPLTVEKFDSSTSVAEFSDPVTSYLFKSAATGLTVGSIKQQTTDLNGPTVFEWDADFFAQYLPLNAEANFVTLGTGWNDKTNVRISESVKFLISGGALDGSFMFNDEIGVDFIEDTFMHIGLNPEDQTEVVINDGPFVGFVRGYDNVLFDETGYDEGQPPDIYSLMARANLTQQEQADILDSWNFFIGGDLVPTTAEQWAYLRARLAEDPNPGLTTTDKFGYPSVGLAMDIKTDPVNTASAQFQEAMVVFSVDSGNLHDVRPYDIGSIDLQESSTAIMYSGSLPPVPTSVPAGATFETFETPLEVQVPSRIFEITFNASPAQLDTLNPQFSIWLPGYPAPQAVPTVEKVSAGKYRFSIARASEAKIIVG
jgi:hypothetical protein